MADIIDPLPRWSLGIHRTPGELAEVQQLIDEGKLPKNTMKLIEDAEDAAVYGADAPKDRKGKRIQQGIGSKGHETGNHFAAMKRAEQMGLEEPGTYNRMVLEIQNRDPKRHALLGLPNMKGKVL